MELAAHVGPGEGSEEMNELPADIKKQYTDVYKDREVRGGCFFLTFQPVDCGDNDTPLQQNLLQGAIGHDYG